MNKALDTDYFGRKLALITRDLSHYTPQEMARELVRLAKVADDSEAVKALATSAAPEEAGALTPSLGLSAADITKLGQYGAEVLIMQKNATIKAHQSVLADRDAEIVKLREELCAAPDRSGKLADERAAIEPAGEVRRFEFTPYGMVESSTGMYCFYSLAAPISEATAKADSSSAAPSEWRDMPMPADIEGDLANAIMDAPCKWKGDPSLHDAVLMGHTMACEQGAILAMKYLANLAQPIAASTPSELHEAAAAFLADIDAHDFGGIPEGPAADRLRAVLAAPAPTGESLSVVPASFQRLETVEYWAKAFADDPQRVAGAMIVKLLNEYAQLRAALATPRQTEDGGLSATDVEVEDAVNEILKPHLAGYLRPGLSYRIARLFHDRAAPKETAVQGGVPVIWYNADEKPLDVGLLIDDVRMITVTGSNKQFGDFDTPLFASPAPTGASK